MGKDDGAGMFDFGRGVDAIDPIPQCAIGIRTAGKSAGREQDKQSCNEVFHERQDRRIGAKHISRLGEAISCRSALAHAPNVGV